MFLPTVGLSLKGCNCTDDSTGKNYDTKKAQASPPRCHVTKDTQQATFRTWSWGLELQINPFEEC